MLKVIATKGLPGVGKSTWARKWVEESPSTRIRVNRDDIRDMLGPYWVPNREDLVTEIEVFIVEATLVKGFDVVVDATNFKSQRWKELAKNFDAEFQIKDFTDVPVEVCIDRDSKRERSVGAEVINNFKNKYLK